LNMPRTKNDERSTLATIDLAAFRWNFRQIQEFVKPAKIGAVVKANAYGHGAGVIAREAERLGAAYLCVANVREGLELRQMGIKLPILVFIPPVLHEIKPALEKKLELTAYSYETARAISNTAKRHGKKAVIQVEIDTGMHHAGLAWNSAVEELQRIHALPCITLKGLYTHYATADWSDLSHAYEQLRRFTAVVDALPFSVRLVHTANSGAVLQMKESYFDMVRPGLSLYGYYPSMQCRHSLSLQPVMSFRSYVAHVDTFDKHESFGYSLTYTTQKKTGIAIVPAGYADGVNRLFSNSGSVLIRGRKCPIVGRVRMDSILVDVGLENGVRQGDEVILFGKQGHQEISVNDWCDKLKTIPYEVTCSVSSRVPRRIINAET